MKTFEDSKTGITQWDLIVLTAGLVLLFALLAWTVTDKRVRDLNSFNAQLTQQNQKLQIQNDILTTACEAKEKR